MEIHREEFRCVHTLGPKSSGGASTHFVCTLPNDPTNELGTIIMQPGPINEIGVVGWTNEALLAIVAHRLYQFQEGPHSCPENEEALKWIQKATNALERRTQRLALQGSAK